MNIISYYLPHFLKNTIYFLNPNKNNNYLLKKPKIDDIKNLKLIILNIDGVLCVDNKPITIAKETFNYFRKNNNDIKICVLTNECRKTPKIIKKELITLGYNMTNIKVISASSIILEYIRSIISNSNSNKILNISLVVEETTYFYIKDNIIKEYNNVQFHWIFDKKMNHNNQHIDYFIIGRINNNITNNNNKLKEILLNSIKNNKDAKFIITSDNNIKNTNTRTTINTLLPIDIIRFINNELNLYIKSHCPFKTDFNIIKNQSKSLYNNDVSIENKEILIIDDNFDNIDNIDINKELNINKGLVLTGITSSYDLFYKTKNQLDKIDYIVPDLSYFFY
jgi:ribonucleotide monophosphatase NagD (HAD superfamily)